MASQTALGSVQSGAWRIGFASAQKTVFVLDIQYSQTSGRSCDFLGGFESAKRSEVP
jgi:hypothetical protein